jgi:hypothetical protein
MYDVHNPSFQQHIHSTITKYTKGPKVDEFSDTDMVHIVFICMVILHNKKNIDILLKHTVIYLHLLS